MLCFSFDYYVARLYTFLGHVGSSFRSDYQPNRGRSCCWGWSGSLALYGVPCPEDFIGLIRYWFGKGIPLLWAIKDTLFFTAQVAFFAVLIELLRLILITSAELPHRVNA